MSLTKHLTFWLAVAQDQQVVITCFWLQLAQLLFPPSFWPRLAVLRFCSFAVLLFCSLLATMAPTLQDLCHYHVVLDLVDTKSNPLCVQKFTQHALLEFLALHFRRSWTQPTARSLLQSRRRLVALSCLSMIG